MQNKFKDHQLITETNMFSIPAFKILAVKNGFQYNVGEINIFTKKRLNEFLKFIQEELKYQHISHEQTSDGYIQREYVRDYDYIHVGTGINNETYVSFGTTRKSVFDKIRSFNEPSPPNIPKIKVLINTQRGIETYDLDVRKQLLVSDNYDEKANEFFHYLKNSISCRGENGRIAIISGPPGTGKTFWIKSLVSDLVGQANFLFIPPSMISMLGSPSLLPVLLGLAPQSYINGDIYIDKPSTENITKKPLVLVLEDADGVLVSRAQDNVDSITTLLNMGDGFLADGLDIYTILTSNQPASKLDKALIRKGRLIGNIEIAGLNKEQALKVVKNLGGTSLPPQVNSKAVQGFGNKSEETYLLCEIYDHVKNGPKEEK